LNVEDQSKIGGKKHSYRNEQNFGGPFTLFKKSIRGKKINKRGKEVDVHDKKNIVSLNCSESKSIC
jgi:hypothetical protein